MVSGTVFRGLAFDTGGNLYATDAGSKSILEFNTTTGTQSTFASGLNNPFYLAFEPNVVPEPSTWALLAAGAGLTGWRCAAAPGVA